MRADIAAGDASVREEIAAAEKRLREEIAATEERLRGEIAATEGRLREEMAVREERLRAEIAAGDAGLREEMAAMEQRLTAATAANLSDLRTELLQQIHQVRREVESNTLHLDRIDTRLAALTLEISGISKARDASEKLDREMLATQSSQQRTIDELLRSVRDLAARVARLEEAIQH